jgi:lactate dehydrogenase-like 2-hydroxyacid dehydrogenase
MSIEVLCLTPVPPSQRKGLAAAGYVLHDHLGPELKEVVPANAGDIRAIITNGSNGATRTIIEGLPKLEIICAMAAGFEGIDLAAADARGIVVTHGPGTNATAVADHAIALMFAVARNIVYGDNAARADDWSNSRRPYPLVVNKNLGIFGLGRIGSLIAKRVSGLDMTIRYHNRRPREDVPYEYCASLKELAEKSDYLILAAPGGPDTKGVVTAEILDALGPKGYLINIARGSMVPTELLAAALKEGRIGGAAIDVYEGEPVLPAALKEITDKLVITPHMAGSAAEARAAIEALMLDNLDSHFAGRPVVTPVPRG